MTENFKKVASQFSEQGDLKGQVSLSVSSYHFPADPEKGYPARSGLTCKARFIKLGSKAYDSTVYFDPREKEVQQAFTEMFDYVNNYQPEQ